MCVAEARTRDVKRDGPYTEAHENPMLLARRSIDLASKGINFYFVLHVMRPLGKSLEPSGVRDLAE